MSSDHRDADLTARARIREAAIELFGKVGYERATTRAIAEAAGVTSGLIRHHFGSKENLLAACDDWIIQVMDELDAETTNLAAGFNPMRRFGQYLPYLARALFEGRAVRVFDHARGAIEHRLRSAPEGDRLASVEDEATVRAAMSLAITVLGGQIAEAFGEDLRSPSGERRLLHALLQVDSHTIITAEEARMYRDELGDLPSAGQPGPQSDPGRQR